MHWILYNAIDDSVVNYEGGEQSELIQFGDRPELGDTLSIGSGREWFVVAVEEYHSGSNRAYVALIAPEGMEAEDGEFESMWADYPDVSFYINLDGDRLAPMPYGWIMDGEQPSGWLETYEPFAHDPSRFKPVSTSWKIAQVEALEGDDSTTYKRLYLCHCKDESLVAA